MLDLHWLFSAIARALVPFIEQHGAHGGVPKRRRVLRAARKFAWVPGPPGPLEGSGLLDGLSSMLFLVMLGAGTSYQTVK